MKEKNAREKASEKWRLQHKEYYKEYQKRYRESHKQKNYNKIYKQRLEMIEDYILDKKQKSNFETIYEIARGKYDEQ